MDGCDDQLHSYYSDPTHREPGCRYGHRSGMCKCHLPLWHEGQDETVFKEFSYSLKQWVVKGFRGMRKKSEGRGRHLSGQPSKCRVSALP